MNRLKSGLIRSRTMLPVAFGLALLAFGLHCGGQTTITNGIDSNTHWMRGCEDDSECGGLSCLCGLCSQSCEEADECKGLSSAQLAPVQCSASACGDESQAASKACVLTCQDTSACPTGTVCEGGSCQNASKSEMMTGAPMPEVDDGSVNAETPVDAMFPTERSTEPTWYGFGPSETEVWEIENNRGSLPQPLNDSEFSSVLSFYCSECHDDRTHEVQGLDSDLLDGFFKIYDLEYMLDDGHLFGGEGVRSQLLRRLRIAESPHPPESSKYPELSDETKSLLEQYVDSLPYTSCTQQRCGEACLKCGPGEASCVEGDEPKSCDLTGACQTEPLNSCVQYPPALTCAEQFPNDRFLVPEQAAETCQSLYGEVGQQSAIGAFGYCHAELFIGLDTQRCLARTRDLILREDNYTVELIVAQRPEYRVPFPRSAFRIRVTLSLESDEIRQGEELLIDALGGDLLDHSEWADTE